MAKLAIFALAISAMLVSSNAFMGFRKLQQVSMRQVLLGTVQPSVGWLVLSIAVGLPAVSIDLHRQPRFLFAGWAVQLWRRAQAGRIRWQQQVL